MRTLTAHDVLGLWETGASQHPIDRALTMLAAAGLRSDRQQLADLPLGERDARLLALYEHLFGAEMVGFAHCPKCGEGLELPIAVAELRRDTGGAAEAPEELACDGIELTFRPLTSRDLAAAAMAGDGERARRLLAERSVLEARQDGEPIDREELPETLVKRLAERLADVDPGAEILIDVECPACRHPWSTLLDAGEFVWAGIRVLAERLLSEIAVLSRAYHWSQAEILGMSRERRRAYLEMCPS